jgi:hypothetical protein
LIAHSRPNDLEIAMKAIVQDKYGSADVLELADIDTPMVGDDNVLLRVHAASTHMGDWHFMTGLPYLFRIVGSGLRAPKTRVRGTDAAGRVEAVGKDVTRFHPGDEVFGVCDGAFAEYATARTDKIAPKPANLTFEQAATVPTSGSTALQALRDAGKVQPGQKVLIIGAAGGVGSGEPSSSSEAKGRTVVRRHRSPAPGVLDVTVRGQEDGHVHREAKRREPGRAQGAHRGRQSPAGHRSDIFAQRGPQGHPLSGRGTRSRLGRHHRLRRTRSKVAGVSSLNHAPA